MSDNVELNAGTGGAILATDDVAGVQFQKIKLDVGGDGATALLSTSNPLPISDAGGSLTIDGTVAVSGTVAVTDNAGSLTVDAPVGTPAFVRLSDGSAAITTLAVSVASIPSHAVTNAGTFATQESGAALTALQLLDNLVLAEDAGHASGDPGVQMLAVRNDSDASLAGTSLDYTPLQVDANGYLKVNIKAGAGSGGTALADDAAFTVATTSFTPIGGVVTADSVDSGDGGAFAMLANRQQKVTLYDSGGVELAVGGGTQYTEDAAAAANPVGNALIIVRDDARTGTLTSADGDNVALRGTNAGELYVKHVDALTVSSHAVTNAGTFAVQAAQSGTWNVTVNAAIAAGNNNIGDVDIASIAAGTNNIGDVDVLTVPADPFGANADASSATGSISAKLRFLAAGIAGATSVPAGTNNIGDIDVLTLPGAAHDAAISGNPVRLAGRAVTADYTSVATGDTADLITTLNGKLVIQPYAIPENFWSYAAASGGIVNTTGVTAKAAAASGIRNYITGLDVVNGHATVSTDVQIRDGAAGTVLWRGFAQAAGGGVARVFDPPLKGTAATLVEVACGTTGTATYFNLTGYIGP